MVAVTEAGATVLPPVPGFYHRPTSIDDLLNQTTGKVLDQFGIEHQLFRRWTSPPGRAAFPATQAVAGRSLAGARSLASLTGRTSDQCAVDGTRDRQDLHDCLATYRHPDDVLVVEERVSADQDVTALVWELAGRGQGPVVWCNDVDGRGVPLVTNLFASRTRIRAGSASSCPSCTRRTSGAPGRPGRCTRWKAGRCSTRSRSATTSISPRCH